MTYWLRLLALSLLVSGARASAQTAVWTSHYDNYRTGANVEETILTPENVNRSSFGKLARLPVSGCVFAQPLYIPNVQTSDGGVRDMVYIATTTNTVYAYDANDYSLQFRVSFGIPAPSADFLPELGYRDFPDCDTGEEYGPVGIVGTPVIDLADNAMYLVVNTIDNLKLPHVHRHFLHKISLSTGENLVPRAEITGSYRDAPFESRYQLQRAALLLLNQRIYVAFGSHQDEYPYQGWLLAYDTNLRQVAAINYSPVKSGAGIWQSGGGPSTDGNYIYVTTGNLADDGPEPTDYTDSILQIDPITLEVVAQTSFYPESQNWDRDFDLDLGTTRPIIIPETGQVVSGSKYGDMFLISRQGMGLEARWKAVAYYSAGIDWTGIYNGLAYWNGTIYVWPGGGGFAYGTDPGFPTDTLKAFSLDGSSNGVTLSAIGQSDGVGVGYQGSNIVISANGRDPSTGIVWAHTPASNTGQLQTGYLRAYNASDFSAGLFKALWDNASDEEESLFAKYNQPLVANGKVFLPTFSRQVIVYGLLAETR
jgi:hypothetical protein